MGNFLQQEEGCGIDGIKKNEIMQTQIYQHLKHYSFISCSYFVHVLGTKIIFQYSYVKF